MALTYTYKFSPDHSRVEAFDMTAQFAGAYVISTQEYIGKRGKTIANCPDPFRNCTLKEAERGMHVSETYVIAKFLKNFNANFTAEWLKNNPGFLDFMLDCSKYPQLVECHFHLLGTLYSELKKLNRDRLNGEDIEYIFSNTKDAWSWQSKCINHYADFYNHKKILDDYKGHPLTLNFIRDKLSDSPSNFCTESQPSLSWYIAITKAFINDGLDDEANFSNWCGYNYIPQVFSKYNFSEIIDDYYNALVVIGEYMEEPIEGGFFMDYARAKALREEVRAIDFQKYIDSTNARNIPEITLNDYIYTPVQDAYTLQQLSQRMTIAPNAINRMKDGRKFFVLVTSNADSHEEYLLLVNSTFDRCDHIYSPAMSSISSPSVKNISETYLKWLSTI